MTTPRRPDVQFQLMLPSAAAARIREDGSYGSLVSRVSRPEEVAAVVGVSTGNGPVLPCSLTPRNHFLNSCDRVPNGIWRRVNPELHVCGYAAAIRRAGISRAGFADKLHRPLPAGASGYPVITYAPAVEDPFPDLYAWWVGPDVVWPIDLEVEPPQLGIAILGPGWPVTEVQRRRALLVGVGSIGSAAAHALALYGIGALTLLDPDRVRWHNLVRHRAGPGDVGKHKVTALREELAATRPDTRVDDLVWDVVRDVDLVRGLLGEIDIVVCCADGVAARRVVSHLARRAGIPAVLGCVLDDGAVGEIVRLQPWPDHGCLICRREALHAAGGIDPDPMLEAGYGTGTLHRPMTAVGGNLHLIGDLTASVAVSTLLTRAGVSGHKIPGEHVVVGLKPNPDLAAPFDVDRTLQLCWSPATPPRPGCPTCEPRSR